MKNKKFLAVAAGICLFATVGYANNYLISGLGFVAPSIIGKSNIYNPQVGEIVYDSVDGTFYGYNQNNQWQALNASASTVPSGTIIAYGGSVAPAGYLLCDGSVVSRTTYSGLYSTIGSAFGDGDGVNTFHVPDLRGRFLRGVDDRDPSVAQDPDNDTRDVMNVGGNFGPLVGSIQNDAFSSHTHTLTTRFWTNTSTMSPNSLQGSGVSPSHSSSSSSMTASNSLAVSGGKETRPKNANVNFIIKI